MNSRVMSFLHATVSVALLLASLAPSRLLAADGSLAGGEEPVVSAAGTPVGEILRFVVVDGSNAQSTVDDGTELNPGYVPLDLSCVDQTRKLGLFEGTDSSGRILPQLGVAESTTDENGDAIAFGPLAFDAPVTERPHLGDTELWQIFNFTADAHPVHLHLTQFDVLERRRISFTDADEDGVPDDVNGDGVLQIDDVLIGEAIDLLPTDLGAQDTSWVGPGEMIGIAATFDLPGEYVWHCHILSHEEHDMMRPFEVIEKLPLG